LKHSILTIFAVLIVSNLCGQNLLSNGDFEDYNICPYNLDFDFLKEVKSWTQPASGTPDYYNECIINSNDSGIFKYTKPFSGSGMVGFTLFSKKSKNYKEYIQSKLKSSLIKDSTYLISFWLKNSEISNYSISTIDVYFTLEEVLTNNKNTFDTELIVSKTTSELRKNKCVDGWTCVSFLYESKGNEKNIIIGNNNNMNLLKVNKRNRNVAYYLIDKISVVKYNPKSNSYIIDENKSHELVIDTLNSINIKKWIKKEMLARIGSIKLYDNYIYQIKVELLDDNKKNLRSINLEVHDLIKSELKKEFDFNYKFFISNNYSFNNSEEQKDSSGIPRLVISILPIRLF